MRDRHPPAAGDHEENQAGRELAATGARLQLDHAMHIARHGAAQRETPAHCECAWRTEARADERSDILLALDEALTRLSALNERIARVVECRYFGGLTEPETAEALGVTARTVRRDWIKAKAWLYAELNDQEA